MGSRWLVISLLMTALAAPYAFSQGVRRDPGLFQGPKKEKDDNTRSVEGIVRDASEAPVAGAVVQIKDTKTLRVRSFITQETGQYQFHGLSTGIDYELKAAHKGSSSEVRTLSVFDSRKQAVIHLKLEARKNPPSGS